MISKNIQFGDAALGSTSVAEKPNRSRLCPPHCDGVLYRISPIGEESTVSEALIPLFSATYDWRRDCHHRPSSRASQAALRCLEERLVVLTLSGRMDAENVIELKSLFQLEVEGRRFVLDLKDLTLVDREAVRFLGRCEADSIRLKNCPIHPREDHARTGGWLAVHRPRAIAYRKQQRNTFGCRFRELT
jgi:hypothetical protein